MLIDDLLMPSVEHERIVCARGKDALLCTREVEMMVRELSLHVAFYWRRGGAPP